MRCRRTCMCVIIVASELALGEHSELQSKYELQLQLNQKAEEYAHQVSMTHSLGNVIAK